MNLLKAFALSFYFQFAKAFVLLKLYNWFCLPILGKELNYLFFLGLIFVFKMLNYKVLEEVNIEEKIKGKEMKILIAPLLILGINYLIYVLFNSII